MTWPLVESEPPLVLFEHLRGDVRIPVWLCKEHREPLVERDGGERAIDHGDWLDESTGRVVAGLRVYVLGPQPRVTVNYWQEAADNGHNCHECVLARVAAKRAERRFRHLWDEAAKRIVRQEPGPLRVNWDIEDLGLDPAFAVTKTIRENGHEIDWHVARSSAPRTHAPVEDYRTYAVLLWMVADELEARRSGA